ncbi:MAG: type II secretion system major pseudopilin GspG [Bdellovibrio sp.]
MKNVQKQSVRGSKAKLSDRGFTLLEILIVMGVIGFLMITILPKVLERLDRSNLEKTRLTMSQIMESLALYQSDCQKIPTDLKFLSEADPDCKRWGPTPYLKSIPKDGWGRAFIYESDGINYTLKSLGKDGRENGSGINQDISSEEL